jgi:hypothetical protein
MADLIYMMNTLVNNRGQILVPGIMADVAPVTDEELATYATIDFDLEHYKKDIGCNHLLHKTDKVLKLKYCFKNSYLKLLIIFILVQNSDAPMALPGALTSRNSRGF